MSSLNFCIVISYQSCNLYHSSIHDSLIFVAVDFLAAMLIRGTGRRLQMSRNRSLKSLDLTKAVNNSGVSYQLKLCCFLNSLSLGICTVAPLLYFTTQCSLQYQYDFDTYNSCQIIFYSKRLVSEQKSMYLILHQLVIAYYLPYCY